LSAAAWRTGSRLAHVPGEALADDLFPEVERRLRAYALRSTA